MPSKTRRWSRLAWLAGLALVVLVGAVVAVRLGRSAPVPEWREIRRAGAAGRWTEADGLLERWLAAHPGHGEALLMLADIRIRGGRPEQAKALLEQVPESSPFRGRARLSLGELALQGRRAAEAEAVFRKLAARDPAAVAPRQRLIYLLSLQQRTAEAREFLRQLTRITNDPRVLVDLALQSLQDQEEVRGIGPELGEFLQQTPDDPFLRRARGLALLYEGKAADALPHLEAAAANLSGDPAGRFALAECRMALGQAVDADEVLGAKPEQPDDLASWWFYHGRLDEALGHPETAAISFAHALNLRPDDREAHFRLGRALERLGRTEEAKVQLDAASVATERKKAARRALEKVRREGLPNDPKLMEQLGQLCLDAGLTFEARAWLEHALAGDPSLDGVRSKISELASLPDPVPIFPARLARQEASAQPNERKPAPRTASSTIDLRSIRFEDISRSAGVDFRYDSGADDRLFLADTMGGGVGLIDHDGDGWLDIYFVNGCSVPWDAARPPSPNRLYRNRRDGSFEDVTTRAGVGGQGYGMGCAVADYDRDGHDDLFVTGLNRTILYRNRGDGTFEDVTARAGVSSDRWTTAAGFGDLDIDGDLDLVVLTYVEIAPDDASTCRDYSGRRIHCSPGRYPGQEDLLFRNNGDGTFTEVSRSAGFVGEQGRGLGLALADFDEDGRLDIFVANDASPDFLFRNLGGLRFEDVAATAGVATNGSGRATASMGVVAQDLDGDGHIDLFITNLVNESNTFFRNLGRGLFQDSTLGAGLDAPSRPRTGFGNAAIDADNDGQLDLVVANGHVDDRPWANSPMAQPPMLFHNSGRGRFRVAGGESPTSYWNRDAVGRGLAAGDLDNDGRVDLVVVHRDGPAALLINRTEGGHWLGLKLHGAGSGGLPVGAKVTCRTRQATIVRWLTSGTGYLSSHDKRLRFGLGPDPVVDTLEVVWPSGQVQSWRDLKADRNIRLVEGEEEVGE